ncbi:hypothetical protein PR003_g8691 [Phytophthora rubi]|uniref:Reverse transcriptase domain-containing protein n=1 Tax=Phytophthora rubi TaxID=129364 RepID=A0A6A3NAM3_9STRA|nr:hypothetical protein PR001_g7878 [Phytophthora rubi]KAE9343987.1 hypothetical protein PR003_g8691 [Phytophthora rubi]
MYAAARDINTSTPQPLLLLDQDGKYILHQRTANQLVKTHFQQQFYDPERPTIAPDREPKPISSPVTPDGVAAAFRRLNNGRASGPDDIPAELLKYGAPVLAPRIAELINTSIEQGLPLALGEGTLLCLPKPNKRRGQCSSLRPIVLLNTIRKAISLIVLARISPAVDTYLSSHQSGSRKHRSTQTPSGLTNGSAHAFNATEKLFTYWVLTSLTRSILSTGKSFRTFYGRSLKMMTPA